MGLDAMIAKLDQFAEQKMQADGTPGLALALTDRERLLHVALYGFADIAARTPVTPDTLFEIGSISKSFASIALLQQHEAGRIDLRQPVTHYLPWFQVQSAYEPITPHHLMSHTAGIIRGSDFDPNGTYAVWALRDLAAAYPPGEHFHYSNLGYVTLGLMLQNMLSQPYGDIIQSRLFDPLDMAASTPVFTHATRQRMAVGYGWLYNDRPPHPSYPLVPGTWVEYGQADGSIAATPADIASYLRMLLNRGQGPHGRILSEESFARLIQPVIDTGEGDSYCYGIGVRQVDGRTQIEHGGGMIGYTSMLIGDMDDGLGIIAMINGPGEAGVVGRYALSLLRAARLGQDLPEPPPLPDPTRVERAGEYAGTYRSGDQSLVFVDDSDRLALHYDGRRLILEQREPDAFYVLHDDFALFPLRFQRQSEQVTELTYGNDWYAGERYAGPTTFDSPSELAAYPGHYRSHNPWLSNFRIVLRKGELRLIFHWGGEEPLEPLEDGAFRVGGEAHLPERLRFGAIADGRALRANLSGCDYYRFFTP